jgi:hypothetical protein
VYYTERGDVPKFPRSNILSKDAKKAFSRKIVSACRVVNYDVCVVRAYYVHGSTILQGVVSAIFDELV